MAFFRKPQVQRPADVGNALVVLSPDGLGLVETSRHPNIDNASIVLLAAVTFAVDWGLAASGSRDSYRQFRSDLAAVVDLGSPTRANAMFNPRGTGMVSDPAFGSAIMESQYTADLQILPTSMLSGHWKWSGLSSGRQCQRAMSALWDRTENHGAEREARHALWMLVQMDGPMIGPEARGELPQMLMDQGAEFVELALTDDWTYPDGLSSSARELSHDDEPGDATPRQVRDDRGPTPPQPGWYSDSAGERRWWTGRDWGPGGEPR